MEFAVENGGCRLHCRKEGQGQVVMLIHGVGCDSSCFDSAIEYLKRYFTVVSYDRCGYSGSVFFDEEKQEQMQRFETKQQCEDARAVLDAMQTREAIVVGVSAGGIVALELADRYPEYVSKLILYEPPLAVEEPYRDRLDQWRKELQEAARQKRTSRALLIFMKALGGIDPEAPGKSLQQQGQNLENLRVFLYKELQDFLLFWERKGKRIRPSMPCMLGAGRMGETGLFSRAAQGNAQKLGCLLDYVEGYHNFAEEQPKKFADWIRRTVDVLDLQQ